MQITLNQNEVAGILAVHAVSILPHIEPEDVKDIVVNEDGSALIIIGEEESHTEDTPSVEAGQPRKQRRSRKNPAEAKHVPVAAKEELTGTQTSAGGQNVSSTQEPEAQAEPEVATGTDAIKEEVTAEAETAASDEVAEEAKAQEEVQQEVVADEPAKKPSLFAGLKNKS